jgi:hypothetical protein
VVGEVPAGGEEPVVGEVLAGEKGTDIHALFAMAKLLAERQEVVVKKVDVVAEGNKASTRKLDQLLLKVGEMETALKMK